MSETKHTPGPWVLEKDPDWDLFHITSLGRQAANLCEICEVEVGYVGKVESEQQANAHLIAAAPELLAACRFAMLHLLDEKADIMGKHFTVRREVQAAITKAENK